MTSQLYGLRTTDSQRQSLPLVNVEAHTVILETISRTTLTQTYLNPSASDPIPELRYAFPLYDGVSVVGFTCRIGSRTIVGQVKERQRAKKDFKDAVLRGDKAALLEQLPSASDVFTTTVGNIPAGAKVVVEITYIGELKHDAEVNGVRFTIPTSIMPRYGNHPVELSTQSASGGRLQVTVDVVLAQSNVIQKVQSPSHPITVALGTTSFAPNADAALSKASATLCLGDAALDKDFIIQVVSKDTGVPTAILETHPTIPNQRALMATLVPKFALPAEKPEVVFICDCSGSMQGSNINLVRSALKVFLKSLPVGIKFNICYFGSSYSFLWPKSATYSQTTLDEAIKHAERISADMGGTEMFQPIKATLDQRYKDIPLAVMLLTDGEIWNQESLFTYLNKEIIEPKAPIRVFTLGIGNGVSHALIEGVAKAGNGFSQSVGEGEKMEGKVVRMLKAALTPHVSDYTLEVKYTSSEVKDKDKDMDMDDDDDFEIVEKVVDGLNVKVDAVDGARVGSKSASTEMKPISLFDPSVDPDSDVAAPEDIDTDEARFAGLPMVTPKLLQSPHIIPPLYAFNRTNVYLLMTHQSSSLTPKSVVLRGVSRHGPLEIEIPIQILDTPGETIHQLGAKSAIAELEQGRGWITQLKDESDGQLFRQKYESRFSDMVEREAVRLGVQFQVGGKWCSFVATETRKERDDDATLNEIGVKRSSRLSRVLSSAKGVFSTASRGTGSSRASFAAEESIAALCAPNTFGDTSNSPGAYGAFGSAPSAPGALGSAPPAGFGSIAGTAAQGVEATVYGIVGLQTFEGYWEWQESLLSCVGVDPVLAAEAVKKHGWDLRVAATALAIVFLEKKKASEKDAWELVVEKAKGWMEEQIGASEVVVVLHKASELVQ
ncbi:MAG: von Willebrand domain-containing protein [Benniella sp.]|nr:MAG: von Willebrand domain-containing protein [Benniella sp.]